MDELPGALVLGLPEELRRGSVLDDLALVDERDVVGDLGPRPGAGRGDPEPHARSGTGRMDDGRGDARAAVRPRGRPPRRVHRRGRDRRARTPGATPPAARARAHPAVRPSPPSPAVSL